MKSEDAHHTRPINVMTMREVSAYLRVHPSTIYRMLKHRQLPAFQVGSDWRFNIEAIDRWRLQQGSCAISSAFRWRPNSRTRFERLAISSLSRAGIPGSAGPVFCSKS
jgi:excisionase family DNA binding protein